MFTIEKNFHNIWVTRDHRGRALPENAAYNVTHNMAMGHDWKHIIWTNSPQRIYEGLLKILPSIPKHIYIKHTNELSGAIRGFGFSDFFTESASGRNPNFAQIVDVMRFMVLYLYGGLVVDCPDTYAFTTKAFGDLECEYGILFYSSSPKCESAEFGHEILAAQKGCPLIRDYLNFIQRRIADFKQEKSKRGKLGVKQTPAPKKTQAAPPRRSPSLDSLRREDDFFDDIFDDDYDRGREDDDWRDSRGLDDFDDYEPPSATSGYSSDDNFRDEDIFDDYDTPGASVSAATPDDVSRYDEYRVGKNRHFDTIYLTGPDAVNAFVKEFLERPENRGKFVRKKFFFKVQNIGWDEEIVGSPLQRSRLLKA